MNPIGVTFVCLGVLCVVFMARSAGLDSVSRRAWSAVGLLAFVLSAVGTLLILLS